MSDPFTWAALAGAGASVLGGILGYDSSKEAIESSEKIAENNLNAFNANNAMNLQFQRENLDYQKHLNQLTMQREDNAIQRRAKDLEAAGLSKTLAAGNGAQASSPIMTQPMHSEAGQKENNQNARIAHAQLLNQVGKSASEAMLMNAQARAANTEANILEKTEKARIAQVQLEAIKTQLGNEATRLENEAARVRLNNDLAAQKAAKELGIPVGMKLNSLEGFMTIANNKSLSMSRKVTLLGAIGGSALVDTFRSFAMAIGLILK